MFEIVEATFLSADVKQFRIVAPRIARKQRAGQFVILRVNDHGERIPITIAGSDPQASTISIIVQGVGKTTKLLNRLEKGDFILDVVGPLGKPSEIEKYGNVVVVGGGVGTAIALPVAKALRDGGNYVTTIVGARTKDLVILEAEMSDVSDSFWITTDDGTHGDQGLVTERLQAIIDSETDVDYVLAIGPIPMMRAVAETTRPYKIKTVVSLNAVMVDGTGMCGGCRVSVAGKSEFACVDGPEFDAHLVDFKSLQQRTAMYRDMERVALDHYNALVDGDTELNAHACRLIDRAEPVDRAAVPCA